MQVKNLTMFYVVPAYNVLGMKVKQGEGLVWLFSTTPIKNHTIPIA